MPQLNSATRLLPGLGLSILVSVAGFAAEHIETLILGNNWLETLVLAIIIGAIVRSCFRVPQAFTPGINWSAKFVLEVAVVLLGASISVGALVDEGPVLVGCIFLVVAVSLVFTYCVGRLLGLRQHLATLVACGNSICGNSAIAAAAPVINAEGDDVASSIAFTAVLGVIVVLLLPMAHDLFGMSFPRYGVLAGLTVYAVPQVLAATAPVSFVSLQMGTLVKLTRVLTLGPVLVVLGLLYGRQAKPSFFKIVPWFIIGFILLMALRSAGGIPAPTLPVLAKAANLLTIVSMAALGLQVDVRSVARSGGRVILTACISILGLLVMSSVLLSFVQIV